MDVVVEESETEYPSFSMKKKGEPKLKRNDSEFDKVVDQVIGKSRSPTPRRDDFSDDDSDLDADRAGGNPLKDFTFVGGGMPSAPQKKAEPKKLDSITAIRDYLEAELGQNKLF